MFGKVNSFYFYFYLSFSGLLKHILPSCPSRLPVSIAQPFSPLQPDSPGNLLVTSRPACYFDPDPCSDPFLSQQCRKYVFPPLYSCAPSDPLKRRRPCLALPFTLNLFCQSKPLAPHWHQDRHIRLALPTGYTTPDPITPTSFAPTRLISPRPCVGGNLCSSLLE